ncbi:MAG: DUF4168 domain-containing protein [Pseudomonadota bacterium]|nr:DUF4168 domain-containing protein [Pseudomonadota bacterium]
MSIRVIRKNLPGALLGLCAASAFGFAAPALAQNPGTGLPPVPQQAVDVSDQQIETFAKAQERVVEIGQKWNQQVQEQGEPSPEDIRKARESAHQEMVIAVEAVGMSVEDYNRIAMAVQGDPDLQKRVQSAR